MEHNELGEGGLFERSSVTRVAIVSEYLCGGKKYLLLIKNTSRDEWELPGGGLLPEESPIAAAQREHTEELGYHLTTTRFRDIPAHQLNTSTFLDLHLNQALTRRGKGVVTRVVLATTEVPELYQSLPLSAEHSDFMYVEIPNGWGKTERQDYRSLLRQFRSRKLVFTKKPSGRIRRLRMTDNPYEIEGRKPNLSLISGLALTAYIEASFRDLI